MPLFVLRTETESSVFPGAPAVAWIPALCSFECWILFHCVDIPHLSLHSLVDGHSGYFYHLAAVNSATNIHVQVSTETEIRLVVASGWGKGGCGWLLNAFKGSFCNDDEKFLKRTVGLHRLVNLLNVLNCALKMVKIVNVIWWVFHTKNEGVAHLSMSLSEVPILYVLPPPLTCPGDFLLPAFGEVQLWVWAMLGLHILPLEPHVLSIPYMLRVLPELPTFIRMSSEQPDQRQDC